MLAHSKMRMTNIFVKTYLHRVYFQRFFTHIFSHWDQARSCLYVKWYWNTKIIIIYHFCSLLFFVIFFVNQAKFKCNYLLFDTGDVIPMWLGLHSWTIQLPLVFQSAFLAEHRVKHGNAGIRHSFLAKNEDNFLFGCRSSVTDLCSSVVEQVALFWQP